MSKAKSTSGGKRGSLMKGKSIPSFMAYTGNIVQSGKSSGVGIGKGAKKAKPGKNT